MKTQQKKSFTYIRTEQGTFLCPTCGAIKQRQNSMHYHMKTHQEETHHSCSYCTKTFLQKQTLELHLRTKHKRQAKQAEEGIGVGTVLDRTEALAGTAGTGALAGTVGTFACPISGCDYRSHTKGNCVIHCLRVHFQEEITPHLRIAEDRRIYSCGHCANEFQSTTAFYYHIKSCITFDQTTPKYRELKALLGP